MSGVEKVLIGGVAHPVADLLGKAPASIEAWPLLAGSKAIPVGHFFHLTVLIGQVVIPIVGDHEDLCSLEREVLRRSDNLDRCTVAGGVEIPSCDNGDAHAFHSILRGRFGKWLHGGEMA